MIALKSESTACQISQATLSPPETRVLKALLRSETCIRGTSLNRMARPSNVLQIIIDLRSKVTGVNGIELISEYAVDRDRKPFSRLLCRLTSSGRQRAQEALDATGAS